MGRIPYGDCAPCGGDRYSYLYPCLHLIPYPHPYPYQVTVYHVGKKQKGWWRCRVQSIRGNVAEVRYPYPYRLPYPYPCPTPTPTPTPTPNPATNPATWPRCGTQGTGTRRWTC